ncbi:MAG: right-handed parallel beta-helix repeat-containing protein [Bacteroidota bacterium]
MRVFTLLLVLLAGGTSLHAATLFVSPQGRDTWSGKLQAANKGGTDGPLASLQGARDAIRKLKAQGPLTEPVTVKFAKGGFPLTAPVVFEPQDSGTADCPIIYQGFKTNTTITAGRKISGFTRGAKGVWTTKIPDVAAGKWHFEQLWVNGYRAVRACTPNMVQMGETWVPRWLYIRKKMPFGVDPLTGQQADLSRRAFYANPEEVADLATVPQDQLQDVNVVAYWAWEVSRHRLAGFDPQTGGIITTGNAPWTFGWLGMDQRYSLENYKAALDAPGEWFLDRDGTLSYIPLPGQDMTKATVVAPVAEQFIQITGDPAAGAFVENITFRDLDFGYAGYTLPQAGHGDGQAVASLGATIVVDGARNVSFERCLIAHTGMHGLWLRRGVRDCSVRQCELFDLGAGGVRIGETSIRPDVAEQTHHNVVDNCLIRSGGRVFPGGIGVWIGQSSDNQVTHNDVSDFFYSGMSVGWSWGYNPTIAHNNKIEFNHIHHLGWGVLSDMGGIYTLGISDGTTLSNNRIHDVWSWDEYGWGGLGLYNDEGSTHITMENNLVYDTRDMTYNLHYGKELTVRNNIFYNGRDYQLQYSRIEPHLGMTFENNIVYWKTGDLTYAKSLAERKMAFDRNVYFGESGKPVIFFGLTFEQWQKLGQDTHSVIADPKFANPEKLDFTLAPDSPALKLGFKPFDWRKAGVYGDQQWVAKAAGLKYAAVQFAPPPPPPPPLELSEDFENYPAGASVSEGQANIEGKGDTIKVSDERGAGGSKKSLKFQDAEGLNYSFDPHLVYSPNYAEGTGKVSFDVWMGPGAALWHEYRDWSTDPYKVGPSLNLIEGKLRLGEKPLLDVPFEQWLHIEVTCHLGASAKGVWELAVTLPSGEVKRYTDLPVGAPGWNKLTWVGFVSNATNNSAFYIDNVKIQNLP